MDPTRYEAAAMTLLESQDTAPTLPHAVDLCEGQAIVLARHLLTHDLLLLSLYAGGRSFTARRPGQYLTLTGDDGLPRPFSIASAPTTGQLIELHVRRVSRGGFTRQLFEQLSVGSRLAVAGPFGELAPRDSGRALLLVAGGTGFAPIQAIAADALERDPERTVTVLWGVRRFEDLYRRDLLETWAEQHPGFRFLPVLDGLDCQAPTGIPLLESLEEALVGDQEVYLCGPPPMVSLCWQALRQAGVSADRIHSG